MKKTLLLLFLSILTIQLSASDSAIKTEKDKYHMFPKAEDGYTRYVVEVPKTQNDYDHRVELLIGKKMMVDCNGGSFSGKVEKKNLEGWGYSYYVVSDIVPGPTTMIACREAKKEKFVTLYMGEKSLKRYNSQLGMVIYVPSDFEVKYKIWSASESIMQAEKK